MSTKKNQNILDRYRLLPPETYHYAEKLIEDLSLEIEVLQSELSPARMEAKYTENFGKQIKLVI